MAKKIEDWQELLVKLGENNDFYDSFSGREIAIIGCSVLDIALAHIIEKRLLDMPKEVEQFLGTNDDGRAPARSLGARIQLALLLGTIGIRGAEVLRAFKALRNKFAHKVSIGLLDKSMQPYLKVISEYVLETQRKIGIPKGYTEKQVVDFYSLYESDVRVAKFTLQMALSALQASLNLILKDTKRIDMPL